MITERQSAALKKLAEAGAGMVSPHTFYELLKLLPTYPSGYEHSFSFHDVRIFKNAFVPDGEIWPLPKPEPKPEFRWLLDVKIV